MKATLDIPDEVASEIQRRADRDGRELLEQIVQLVRLGLLASDVPVAALEQFIRTVREVNRRFPETPSIPGIPRQGASFAASAATDAATGLPVVKSPPDAPVHTMSVDEILALTTDVEREDDLERAGLPLRQ